jgi:HAD superfamily hydrolase (TIGR01450 family)
VLLSCDTPLWEAHDLALLDLDGVVYVGSDAVPGAVEHLARAAKAGMRLAYVTNNAARPPAVVADHLRELGIEADDADVVTSAQAAARLLAERLDPGAPVFVIGGDGLFEALREEDLEPVQDLDADPVAVVSGYHRGLTWGTVTDGAVLVGRGLPWVASNTDRSVPTPAGRGPGNGVLVGAVADFTGVSPQVAGKPQPTLFHESVRRVGGDRPLVVGDRLDTDIEGAHNTDLPSLLVLTGVTDLEDLVAAAPRLRPSFIAPDLAGLGEPQPAVEEQEGGFRAERLTARVDDGRLVVAGEGSAIAWWRVVAAASWRHLDTTGRPVALDGVRPPSSVGP